MVAEVFEDNGASAFKQRGPATGWGRMLAGAKAGTFRYVVAVDLDRLLRGQADLLALIETGARVVTVDGELDLGTADGEFRATMTAAIARFEDLRKSERQKRANAHRVSQGKPVPGKRRYGYESDGVTLREDEAQVGDAPTFRQGRRFQRFGPTRPVRWSTATGTLRTASVRSGST
ncbi:hypothetical protein BIU97_04415 [Curtobacterium sp. MCBA15_009]|nr:hypothetical protein BIU97_04415 [Curtobacterium sp. MCBA15_009]